MRRIQELDADRAQGAAAVASSEQPFHTAVRSAAMLPPPPQNLGTRHPEHPSNNTEILFLIPAPPQPTLLRLMYRIFALI